SAAATITSVSPPAIRSSSFTERAAVALPATLLVVVACAQIALTRLTPLSPWKGGGFGMFASLDGLQFREVRLYVEGRHRPEALTVPDSLLDPANRAAVWPTPRLLRRLGREVLAREARKGAPADRVRVEIWRTRFSPSLDSTIVPIATLTVERDADLA